MVIHTVDAMKTFVTEQRGNLAGGANMDCLETDFRHRGPYGIMPETQSIVFFAQRMPRGFLEGLSPMVVTVHDSTVSSSWGCCPASHYKKNESGDKGRRRRSGIKHTEEPDLFDVAILVPEEPK